jgi:hypothetical protein
MRLITDKLNVTKDFTDSLILVKMGEPYRANIKKIKARSREYRQSISNFIESKGTLLR